MCYLVFRNRGLYKIMCYSIKRLGISTLVREKINEFEILFEVKYFIFKNSFL